MKQSHRICVLALIVACLGFLRISAQDIIHLWSQNAMPNHKVGVQLQDSVARERAFIVTNPYISVFHPSKAENKHAAVLIIPGGGYVKLAYEISGFALAKWFNTMGITACVLFHRLPNQRDVEVSYRAPLQDAQRALRLIRAHASDWDINPKKVGVMGSSAGGHLAACASTIREDWAAVGDSLDALPFRADFSILVSPVIDMSGSSYENRGSHKALLASDDSEEWQRYFSVQNQVADDTPPAILFHAQDDNTVPSINSLLYYRKLREYQIKGASLHIFPEGAHSISLRDNPGSAALFPLLTEMWLQDIHVLE